MTTRALEDSEIKVIFEQIDGINLVRNKTMLIVGIGLALRASELVGLQVGDVYDLSACTAPAEEKAGKQAGGEKVRNYIKIRGETAKFGKEREIRVWAIVREKLAEFIDWKKETGESLDPSTPLFVSREGGHLTTKALYYLTKKIFQKVGIDQSPHALRKTGATIFYEESDYDLVATQLFLGHADPSTTKKYIGVPSKKTIETCRRSSNRLSSLLRGEEFTTRTDMVNSDLTIEKAIIFLNQKGFTVTLSPKEHSFKKKNFWLR